MMLGLTTEINQLQDKDQKYIRTVIKEYNTHLKNIEKINGTDFRLYVLNLVRQDYLSKIDYLTIKHKDAPNLIYFLRNYIIARYREHLQAPLV